MVEKRQFALGDTVQFEVELDYITYLLFKNFHYILLLLFSFPLVYTIFIHILRTIHIIVLTFIQKDTTKVELNSDS